MDDIITTAMPTVTVTEEEIRLAIASVRDMQSLLQKFQANGLLLQATSELALKTQLTTMERLLLQASNIQGQMLARMDMLADMMTETLNQNDVRED